MTLEKALLKLKNDEVVGMPTETVYGLAGNINSEIALKKIFSVKGRPFFDPLIVHVSSIEEAKKLVISWPLAADLLAKTFWPGPLTIVMKKNKTVSDLVTSGLDTVAIRMPNHKIALELISKFKNPLAAPSANKFGKTSPTCKAHVDEEFKNDDVLVLDGGACEVGLESTVIGLEQNADQVHVSILRAGKILLSEVISVLEKNNLKVIEVKPEKKLAPGQMKHHYMPNRPLIIVRNEMDFGVIKNLFETKIKELPDEIENVKIIKPSSINSFSELVLSDRPELAAREFYAKLRELGNGTEDVILFKVKDYHKGEIWDAFFDRINKAATLVI